MGNPNAVAVPLCLEENSHERLTLVLNEACPAQISVRSQIFEEDINSTQNHLKSVQDFTYFDKRNNGGP